MTKLIKDVKKKTIKIDQNIFGKTESDLDNLNMIFIKLIFKRKTCSRDEWKPEWLPHCTKNVLKNIESFYK